MTTVDKVELKDMLSLQVNNPTTTIIMFLTIQLTLNIRSLLFNKLQTTTTTMLMLMLIKLASFRFKKDSCWLNNSSNSSSNCWCNRLMLTKKIVLLVRLLLLQVEILCLNSISNSNCYNNNSIYRNKCSNKCNNQVQLASKTPNQRVLICLN